jgi:hypothetical protein
METLNEDNVHDYAMIHYRNPQCTCIEDFLDDMKKPKLVRRLFSYHMNGKELKIRLILNHIISFYNVFPVEVATKILFLRIDSKQWHLLKTFLSYLNFMPSLVKNVNGENIFSDDINIDEEVLERLQEL